MEVQKSGGIPIMAYRGRLFPEGVHFSGFKYMEGLGISLLDPVHKKVGKYVISVF